MVDAARVNLYGQPIGSVRWDQRYEVAQFEYDPDFVRQGIEPSPLMMPVREGRVYTVSGSSIKRPSKACPGCWRTPCRIHTDEPSLRDG